MITPGKNRFQTIFDRNQMYLADIQKKSKNWYWSQVEELKKQRITPSKLLNDTANNSVNKIVPGEMYFYKYDPKTKETLPYYDTFPMVFPFTALDDGFIALNLHYLPYRLRIIVLSELSNYKDSTNFSEKTKIEMSWTLLKGMSSNKLIQPCVKRYLYSHIKSKIIKIDSFHWTTALMMPVARFVKANEQTVWLDSLKGSK